MCVYIHIDTYMCIYVHIGSKLYYKSLVATWKWTQPALFLATGIENTAKSCKAGNGNTNDW